MLLAGADARRDTALLRVGARVGADLVVYARVLVQGPTVKDHLIDPQRHALVLHVMIVDARSGDLLLTNEITQQWSTADPEATQAAREWGADLVALTTHGRTGAARAYYGSVAERILSDAPVPLLVVRSRSLAAAVVPGPEAGPIVHVT